MVSTLDFESSDPSSNLGGTSLIFFGGVRIPVLGPAGSSKQTRACTGNALTCRTAVQLPSRVSTCLHFRNGLGWVALRTRSASGGKINVLMEG